MGRRGRRDERQSLLYDGRLNPAYEQMRKENAKLLKKQKRYLLEIIKSIKSNSEALMRGEDGECLHDLRVAVRKLSSLTSLFEKNLDYSFDSGFKHSLKNIISVSSKLRDIDGLELFAGYAVMGAQKSEYLLELTDILAGMTLWKSALGEYIMFFRWLGGDEEMIEDFRENALERIIAGLKKTSKRYRKLTAMETYDFEGLHTVRKRCKRYRYQLDFVFMDANEGSLVCKKIQDRLGVVNDYRTWLDIAKDAGLYELAHRLQSSLLAAINDINTEGKVFASKEYCGYLFEGLRKRLAML